MTVSDISPGLWAVLSALGAAVLGWFVVGWLERHGRHMARWLKVVLVLSAALAVGITASPIATRMSELGRSTSPPQSPSTMPTTTKPTQRASSSPGRPSASDDARSATPASPMAWMVDHYDDAEPEGHAVCTGNVNDHSAQPSGVVTQSFTVPSGFTSITSVLVQVDPQPTLTVHLSIAVDGEVVARSATQAAGDTQFDLTPIGVQAGDSVTTTFTMSSTAKAGVTMYTTPGGYGTVTFDNSCAWGGGANLTSTVDGLRMRVEGSR